MYYITADIETTGLDIYKDVPIQMAYTVHDNADVLLHEHSFCININRELPAIITKITGFTKEILTRDGISPASGMNLWCTVLRKFQPVTLIGYNILNFDLPMIQNWINAISTDRFKFPAICQVIDVMAIVAAKRQSKWMKLGEAATLYDIEFEVEELHNAMTDIRVTWELYKKIRG